MKLTRAKPVKPAYSYDPRRDGVSQSMIGTWLSCREKARINIVHGWSSQGTNKPFTFGDISHGVLEMMYSHVRSGGKPTLSNVPLLVLDYASRALKDWQEKNPRRTHDADDLAEECTAIIQELHSRYFKHWYQQDKEVTWTHVEDKFEVPLKMPDGSVVKMVGRFDGVFTRNKKLWLFETKNKSQWSERLIDFLPLDLQLGYYLTALEAIEHKDPVGVRFNIIRRPGEKRSQTESMMQYVKRIGKNVDKKPDHYFARFEITLTREEKEEHKFRCQKLVEEFYLWWKSTTHKTRDLLWNSGQCEGKYGVCGNIGICSNQDYSNHYIREHVSPELAAE